RDFHMTGVQTCALPIWEILASGGYVCSDDVLGGVTLAKHGAGLFQTYRFIVERELADGTLVEVLQPFAGRSRPFTLLYPHGRHEIGRASRRDTARGPGS